MHSGEQQEKPPGVKKRKIGMKRIFLALGALLLVPASSKSTTIVKISKCDRPCKYMLASRKGTTIVKIIHTSIHLTYEVARIDWEIPMKLYRKYELLQVSCLIFQTNYEVVNEPYIICRFKN